MLGITLSTYPLLAASEESVGIANDVIFCEFMFKDDRQGAVEAIVDRESFLPR